MVVSEHKSQPADVASPVSVRSVMLRFVLTGLLTMAIVALAMAWVSRNVGTEQAIADARQISWVSAQGIIEPALTDEVLAMDADALDALDAAVRNNVLRGSLVRVKIWDESGTIVYSDEPRLIGERYAIEDDMQAVFATGEGTAEITDLTSLENRYEVETKLLEVYQLVETAEGTPLVFETYFRYSGVTDVGRLLWGRFAPISIGSLVALQLIQFPFAWRMARRRRRRCGRS